MKKNTNQNNINQKNMNRNDINPNNMMTNAEKESIKATLEYLFKIYPADENLMYDIPIGRSYMKLNGETVNDMAKIVMGGAEVDGETPDEYVMRKYHALVVRLKHRFVNHLSALDENEKKNPDFAYISAAILLNNIEPGTLKIARKYFEI